MKLFSLISQMPTKASPTPEAPLVAKEAGKGLFKPFTGVFKGLAWNACIGPLAIGMAVNADVPALSQEAGDGWLMLAPYGDTDYWHQENSGEWKLYRQVFGREQAARMVTAFNALLGKKGARFRGLPIYKGHPDADPKRWPDEARLGGIMAMDARADALYVKTAWNDAGQANLTQGYLVYPSPAWLYDMRAAKQTGRIEPDELKSVGLTNSPRIADVDAWTNSDPDSTHQPTAEDIMIRKALLKILGLAEDVTDDQIQTAVNSHFSGDVTAISLKAIATNAETARTTAENLLATRTTERDAALTDVTTFRRVAVNALLDSAINEGRLTAAERPEFERQFATNFETASTALSKKQPALPRQEIDVRRGADLDLSTSASRKIAWNTLTEDLMDGGKRTLDQAIHAARQDPRGKQILKAMEDADKVAANPAK